ncbi:hypothetical protein FRC01_001087 [Tulasnella sp. 417]|nr:hypothetical protein FRC01_001087 [Tulasnella sp. 417]
MKPKNIGDGWIESTNPEGDRFFHHIQRHIVTQTNVQVLLSEQVLFRAHDHLIELGRARDPQIAEREVYIHVAGETPVDKRVEYYFIDNEARHPFWVHGAKIQDLGIQGFETLDHLRASLVSEYWTHIEYFPAHQVLERASENELISIFRYGCADDMTSFGSTFPYGAQESREHLQTLEGFIASGEFSAYRTATFARLWASITRVRHINNYGLPGPRLDRNQGLVEFKKSQQPTLILRILDVLFLTLPRSKFDLITELWNGRVVFQRHWHTYFDDQRREWLRLAVLVRVQFGTPIILYFANFAVSPELRPIYAFREAHKIHSRTGNKLRAANALDSLKRIYNGGGEGFERSAGDVLLRRQSSGRGEPVEQSGTDYDTQLRNTFREAHEIHSRIGVDLGSANPLDGLGRIYDAQSRYQEAEIILREAHEIYSRIENDMDTANALDSLGGIYDT